ncbi:hypothetical protein [Spongorhabdus nitratireducens]
MKYRRLVCYVLPFLILFLPTYSPAAKYPSRAYTSRLSHGKQSCKPFYSQPASTRKAKRLRPPESGLPKALSTSEISACKQSDLIRETSSTERKTKPQARKELKQRCEDQGIKWNQVRSETMPASCPSQWLWNLKKMVGCAFSKSGNTHHSIEMALEEYDNGPWLNIIARIAFNSVIHAYGMPVSELARAWLEYELIENNQSNKFSIQAWLDSDESTEVELETFRATSLMSLDAILSEYHLIWSPPQDCCSNIGRFLTAKKQPATFGSMVIWDFMKELELSVIPYLPEANLREADKLISISYKRILRCILSYYSSDKPAAMEAEPAEDNVDEGFCEEGEYTILKQASAGLAEQSNTPYMHIAVQIWLHHLLQARHLTPMPDLHSWLLEDR